MLQRLYKIIMGICISCKQLCTDSEGSAAAMYEYIFTMGSAFY